MVYYNIPWNQEHYLQSLDRNHRIGQQRKVTVYRLIANHTIDEAKVTALEQKTDINTLITHKLPCIGCKDYTTRCAKYNIELYDELCKYDRTFDRTTAKLEIVK